MGALLELDILGERPDVLDRHTHALVVLRLRGALAAAHELPEALHVLARDDLVLDAAEHEDGRAAREERDARGRVPLLVAEERERAEHGQRARHEAREREERVLEHERAHLRAVSGWGADGARGRTARGLRLARSIATAPPMDWPYSTSGVRASTGCAATWSSAACASSLRPVGRQRPHRQRARDAPFSEGWPSESPYLRGVSSGMRGETGGRTRGSTA